MQKAAYGGGAFAFVFTAAMAGTAAMITGGFFPGPDTPSAPLQRAAWLEPGYISDAPPVPDAPWTTYDEARPIQYADSAEARQIAYTATDAARSDFDNGLLEAYSEPMQIETDGAPAIDPYAPEVLEGDVVIAPKKDFGEAELETDEDDLFAEADGGAFPSF